MIRVEFILFEANGMDSSTCKIIMQDKQNQMDTNLACSTFKAIINNHLFAALFNTCITINL